jgi:hypothetical protein
MRLKEKFDNLIEKYRCKHHQPAYFENPHGCTDCYNVGYIFDNEEIFLCIELEAENTKLREGLKFYTHEQIRDGFEVSEIIQGHKYDVSCTACEEQCKGKLARQILKEVENV